MLEHDPELAREKRTLRKIRALISEEALECHLTRPPGGSIRDFFRR